MTITGDWAEVGRQESRSLAASQRAGSTEVLHAHQLDTVPGGGMDFFCHTRIIYTQAGQPRFSYSQSLDDHSFQHGTRDGTRVVICRLDGLFAFSYTYGLAV
jgi:hypothetical protein